MRGSPAAVAQLPHGHDPADEQHQRGEGGEQHILVDVGRGLGAEHGATDRDEPEVAPAAEQHVAGAVGGDRADQRCHADDDQRAGRGLGGALVEEVDQDGHRQDRAAAAEGAQAEPDQRPGRDREDEGQASGPTRCRPTFSAFSKLSSIATRRATGGVEHRGGDPGAVAAGAVHPDLARRDLVDALGQLVDAEC